MAADHDHPGGYLLTIPAPRSSLRPRQASGLAGTVRLASQARIVKGGAGDARPASRHRCHAICRSAGIGWLVGAVLLIGLVIVGFVGGLRGAAVDVTVADDAVVGWLGGLNVPGLVAVMQVLAMVSSWWVLKALSVALLLALLALRRFRHLIVYAIFSGLLSLITTDVLGAIAQRPRPVPNRLTTSDTAH
jgi:hypothetical protein